MKTLTHTISTAVARRFFVVAPLLSACAALLATPTVQASTLVDQVDIIDGKVDVDQSGGISTRDDATDVLLVTSIRFSVIRVDIIDGLVDVTENGAITTYDDLYDFALNDPNGVTPTINHMDIIDGLVDVNQGGFINTLDDANDVKLVRLVNSVVDQVDITEGLVDVNEDGVSNGADNTFEVLLAHRVGWYPPGGLTRVDVLGGKVDVNESGLIDEPDRMFYVGLYDFEDITPDPLEVQIGHTPFGDEDGYVDVELDDFDNQADVRLVRISGSWLDKADIIDGKVDVDQNGVAGASDDLNDVLLLFGDGAPLRVDIIDGLMDVTESGIVSTADDLLDTALTHDFVDDNNNDACRAIQVDIIDGMIDTNEDGSITPLDDVPDVRLLVP